MANFEIKFCMKYQEPIIFRSGMRNPKHNAYFYFWPSVGKIGLLSGKLAPPRVGGSKPNQNLCPLDGPFGSTVIPKACSQNKPPPPSLELLTRDNYIWVP